MDHPLKDTAVYIRKEFIETHPEIGESIYWNGPTFYYTGAMPDFDHKAYKRYLAGINCFKKDSLALIFLKGERANYPNGLLQGNYTDGRRIAYFTSVEDVKNKEKSLKEIIQELISKISD